MAAVINTNISSLNAQRNLTMSQSSLATSLQRLSSGLRINSAKDDAAGLAISQRMTSQINGLNRASQNANDGISLSQTAEGALGQVGDSLQRIRELAVQSANATNSSSDRAALQQEVSQLVSEITRIGNTTSFNGLKILDGSYTNQQYQIGANAGETINVSIASAKASQLGNLATETGTAVSAAAATDITVALGGGPAVAINSSAGFVGTESSQDATSAYAKAAAINAANIAGLSVEAKTEGTQTVGAIGGTAADTYNLTINGTAIFSNLDVSTALSNTNLRDAINAASDQTGVTATLNGGDLTLTAADGRNIDVTESGTGFTAGTDGLTVTGGDFAATLRGNLSVSAGESISIGGTVATVGLNASITVDPTKSIGTIDIGSIDGANDALRRVDAALTQISSSRAELGAIQNRFTAVVANLSTTSENLSASRSRIQDADFAAETANMTRGQILQQAGTAMLAQANSLPNGVLALLR